MFPQKKMKNQTTQKQQADSNIAADKQDIVLAAKNQFLKQKGQSMKKKYSMHHPLQVKYSNSLTSQQQVRSKQPTFKQISLTIDQFIHLWLARQINEQKLKNLQVNMDFQKGTYRLKGPQLLLVQMHQKWKKFLQSYQWLFKISKTSQQSIIEIIQSIQCKIYMQQYLLECLFEIQCLYNCQKCSQFRTLKNVISQNPKFTIIRYKRCNVQQKQLKRYRQKDSRKKQNVQEAYDNLKDSIISCDYHNSKQILQIQVDKVLKIYLDDQQVQNVVRSEIKQKMKQLFPQYFINKVNFSFGQLSLQIDLQSEDMEIFKRENKQKICQKLLNDLNHDIQINKLLYHNLKKKFLLRENKYNDKYMLITKSSEATRKLSQLYKQIEQLKKIVQETLQISGKCFPFVKIYIQSLEKYAATKQCLDKINIKFDQEKQQLKLIGFKIYVDQIFPAMKIQVDKIMSSIRQTNLVVSQKQADLFEKLYQEGKIDSFKNYSMEAYIKKKIKLGIVVSLSHSKYLYESCPLIIYITNNYDLGNIPTKCSFIVDSIQELDKFIDPIFRQIEYKNNIERSIALQAIKQIYDKRLINAANYRQNLNNQIIKIIENESYQGKIIIGFVMPKQNKQKFIQNIIRILHDYLNTKYFRVYVLQDPQVNVEDQLKIFPRQRGHKIMKNQQHYYVQQGDNKLYYSRQANQKILLAKLNKVSKIILTDKDLQIKAPTHKYNKQSKELVHLNSKKEYEVQVYPNKIYIKLENGQLFEIPQDQFKLINQSSNNIVQLTIGFYEIDLRTMKQLNKFSDYQRKIRSEVISKVQFEYYYNLNIKYDHKISKINILYQSKNSQYLLKTIQSIRKVIEQNKYKEIYKLDNQLQINEMTLQHLNNIGTQLFAEIGYDKHKRSITIQAFDKFSLAYLLQTLKFMVKKDEEQQLLTIQYPKFWQKQQQDINIFKVLPKTAQFKEIQEAFKHPIVQLIRIQNRVVFKRYFQEKIFLKNYINSGRQIKELNLFHGTRNTNPELIYLDKQESFNINYTRERNFFGKGTYFAQQPDYSIDFSYKHKQKHPITLKNIKSLFYCSVLVGDSQKLTYNQNQQQRNDTDYKDEKNKVRYESATSFINGTNMYIVYKNRRAYPHYLIKFQSDK